MRGSLGNGPPAFSVSENAVLVYGADFVQISRLTWFDRRGNQLESFGSAGNYAHIELSPDDSQVVVEIFDSHARVGDVWSRDVRFIVYQRFDPKGTLSLLPLFGDRQPLALLKSNFNEAHGRLSPDGRWLAYTSDESGRDEVYVQAFPTSGPSGRCRRAAVRTQDGGGIARSCSISRPTRN